jgi:uncharacterized membrane protein YpjA
MMIGMFGRLTIRQAFLPKGNLSSKYIFAKNNTFLAYPKNYNHFVNYYKDTYQHGGISLEEVIIDKHIRAQIVFFIVYLIWVYWAERIDYLFRLFYL